MTNERILAIDDCRELAGANVLARTYRDGESALRLMGPFNQLWLDHDLGCVDRQYSDSGKELTGYDIVLLLEQYPELRPNSVLIVSSNPVGVQRMRQGLERIYKTTSITGVHFSDPIKE